MSHDILTTQSSLRVDVGMPLSVAHKTLACGVILDRPWTYRLTGAVSCLALAPLQMLEAQILEAARTKQTGVSLQTLLQFGQLTQNAKRQALIGSAQFLKRELPIRFAHRIVELEALPHGLSNNAHVKKIADWYRQSFEGACLQQWLDRCLLLLSLPYGSCSHSRLSLRLLLQS